MRPILPQLQKHRLLIGILAIFVVLSAVTYNVTLPSFEAPDEADHYRFARWLASGQGYPDLVTDAVTAGHEIWQTPLYYAILSPLVSLANGGEPHETAPLNPGYQAGYSRLVHVHTAVEMFPYAGTSLAVHLARLITTAFGVGVILAAYGLAQIVWPRAALIAAALARIIEVNGSHRRSPCYHIGLLHCSDGVNGCQALSLEEITKK